MTGWWFWNVSRLCHHQSIAAGSGRSAKTWTHFAAPVMRCCQQLDLRTQRVAVFAVGEVQLAVQCCVIYYYGFCRYALSRTRPPFIGLAAATVQIHAVRHKGAPKTEWLINIQWGRLQCPTALKLLGKCVMCYTCPHVSPHTVCACYLRT